VYNPSPAPTQRAERDRNAKQPQKDSRFEHAANLSESALGMRNGAQREGRECRVAAVIFQGDLLPISPDKLHRHSTACDPFFGKAASDKRRLHGLYLAHRRGIMPDI
jgi:hypothetical protein